MGITMNNRNNKLGQIRRAIFVVGGFVDELSARANQLAGAKASIQKNGRKDRQSDHTSRRAWSVFNPAQEWA